MATVVRAQTAKDRATLQKTRAEGVRRAEEGMDGAQFGAVQTDNAESAGHSGCEEETGDAQGRRHADGDGGEDGRRGKGR